MIRILLFLIIIPAINSIAQTLHSNENNFFTRYNGYYSRGEDINYYPLSNGDYWEYIEKDTVTIVNQFYGDMNFSVTKEILCDTLMSNGLTYKKIRWRNEANSVNYPPFYEYHRKDTSGNIYLYYQGNDYLLYDVNAETGYTYPSHLPGYIWRVADKYNVIGFGDTLAAVDFELLENGAVINEAYTLVENFGIIYYRKSTYSGLPEGSFWGAVIDGREFGNLIVNKQAIDWSQFYPLHVGDYWVYEGASGSIPFIETHRITGDTLMPDGDIYFIKDGNTFERLDSSGNLYGWSESLQSKFLKYIFTVSVGDTTKDYIINYLIWRLNNKLFYNGRFELYRFLYPDLIFNGEYYDEGLGLYEWSIEGGYGILRGAYINGVLYGDTTVLAVKDLRNPPKDFILEQNYPNPFNPTTIINYTVSKTANVRIKVFDILGREVKTLVNEEKSAGSYEVKFDGSSLPSGVYIYRLTADSYTAAKKLLLLK